MSMKKIDYLFEAGLMVGSYSLIVVFAYWVVNL
jgi:hypothetical protein